MQVLRTECSVVVKPNDDAMHLVRFVGQGGESVDVTLAAGSEAIDDAEMVQKAAAIMVQVAVSLASNAGQENEPRDVDEPLSRLQRFRFAYSGKGKDFHEIPNVELPSVEAAQAEAIRSARDLYRDVINAGQTPSGWAVRVYDENGNQLFEVSFEDVNATEQHREWPSEP